MRTPAPTSTWMGRSVEEIERVWGASPQRESDGEGGSVLAYRQDTSLSVTAATGPNRHSLDPPATADVSDPQRTQTERITKVLARFWVDGKGTVYRYWFAQEIYAAGRDTPPPKESEE